MSGYDSCVKLAFDINPWEVIRRGRAAGLKLNSQHLYLVHALAVRDGVAKDENLVCAMGTKARKPRNALRTRMSPVRKAFALVDHQVVRIRHQGYQLVAPAPS